MDSSLNIVSLIESNPITKLSGKYNNKFLVKIKETFTETEQQLFVSSFYCYLNYDEYNDFVIDLDNIWEWLGYSQKVVAKLNLEKNFIIDEDYKSSPFLQQKQKNDGRGGHNREQIMMTINTFKLFCLSSGTKKANEIHKYFVKLERIFKFFVNEETDEMAKQLKIKDEKYLELENKNSELENKLIIATEENKLLQIKEDYPYMYIFNLNEKDVTPPKLKIGFTKNVNNRIKPYKQTNKNGKLELVVEVLNQNIRTIENFIHSLLSNFNIAGEVFQLDVEEAKFIVLRVVNMIKINNITNSAERCAKLSKLYENELVVVDNQLPEKISTREFSCQTDFTEEPITNTEEKDELTASFHTFITEHCIVRDDVEISSTDIIGQYRIISQSTSKEKYHKLKEYLDIKFKQSRLKTQNKSQVVNGYKGITLKEIKYNKSLTVSDEQNFIFHACQFSPSGKVLFDDLLNEYVKWKNQKF
jgi:hypothetical protein